MHKSSGKFQSFKIMIMIVTSVFSFTSMSNAFFLKGYSAIPWFIFSALVYFVPYCFILSDLTGTYNDQAGGIYTWLKDSTSQKLAFVTTLLWYCSYFIWMIALFMKTWIPLSILLFGKDLTQEATLFGLPTLYVIGFLGILLIATISLVILGGFHNILNLSYFSGRCMLILVAVMAVASLACLGQNQGHFQESFQLQQLLTSHGEFQTTAENLSFFIFGITAFGGLDTVACLVNKTGSAQKSFSRLILISGGIIIAFYMTGIFLWGAGIDLASIVGTDNFHLGNIMYGLMGQLALNVSAGFGLSAQLTQVVLQAFLRLTALTLFSAYMSLLSIISFGPLQSLTQSLQEAKLGLQFRKNQAGMPVAPVIFQGVALAIFVAGICLFQDSVGSFYNQLTLMTNISRSIPYFLVALSYPSFKRLYPQNTSLPFLAKKRVHYGFSFSVMASVLLSISFTVYEKIAAHELLNAGLLVLGPVLFAILGVLLFRYMKRRNQILPSN